MLADIIEGLENEAQQNCRFATCLIYIYAKSYWCVGHIEVAKGIDMVHYVIRWYWRQHREIATLLES